MNEYISKQSVLDYLNGYLHSIGEYNLLLDIGQRRALTNTIQDISAVKAADVQPIKHGRWVVDEHGYLRCDNCGEVCLRNDIGIYVKSWYCPECGADMRLRGDAE